MGLREDDLLEKYEVRGFRWKVWRLVGVLHMNGFNYFSPFLEFLLELPLN